MTTTAATNAPASSSANQPSGLEEDISRLAGHTVMLVQFSSNEETRTYIDCESPLAAMETFCRIYENFLLNKKGLLPGKSEGEGEDKEMREERAKKASEESIEYKLEDILKFVDQLYDLSALTYNDRAFGFTAHGKAWFKGKIHAYLRKLAEAEQWENQIWLMRDSDK